MNRQVVSTMLAAAVMMVGATAARADDGAASDGPFEVRVRAVYLEPAHRSDAVPSLAIPADAIQVNDKWLPELDLEYYFTPNWSSELILTYPQNQTVTVKQSALGGPVDIGTFRHLPPILTAKYNFRPGETFRPYVGVGVNITYISDVNLTVPTVGNLELSHWSVGPAVQVGADWQISKHVFFNTDIKWAMLKANVTLDDTHVTQVQLNPLIFGVGFGYRF